ncbi:MAG: alpha/beta fold hydrolase [Flavisolibacter sp.]|jgi:dienelactone hydrolase|nr:alpha/beta fold hydrolase [Flavisolibacter sp.]
MQITKNILIDGAGGKPIALDIFYTDGPPKPAVIYAHGFNGFKDWGRFDMIATQFAEAGFCFIKFNFSHNGGTPEAPEDFVDLEAYGKNNYTKELYDLQKVIDWVLMESNPYKAVIDSNKVLLIGHSRGGGIVLLKGAEEKRIKAIATWASVSQCKTPWGSWPDDRMQKWKETGVEYYSNSRTKQQMPLYYQLHEDYKNNRERLDVLKATKELAIPILICHGTADEAVPVMNAHLLHEAAKGAELFLVESDHVFGRKHPWTGSNLPEAMQAVVSKTIQFFSDL